MINTWSLAKAIDYSLTRQSSMDIFGSRIMPILTAIHIYPLKSASSVSLPRVSFDRFGPAGDRRWMIIDAKYRFVSQRENARLAVLEVTAEESGLRLALGDSSLSVPRPPDRRRRDVVVWEDRVSAVDAGNEVAQWLSERLDQPLRLVYMPEASHRYVDGRYATEGETVSFADGFPVLLVTTASVEMLNARLSRPVGADRFRPNLVVSGCEAHAEDHWNRIRIGSMEFTVAKPCARCVMPSIDQRSGERDSEILGALASYRRRDDRQVYFGQNLLYDGTGSVAIGDSVEVLPD
jgi:uncharacterized protein YcbX